jgi:hypothetical protein
MTQNLGTNGANSTSRARVVGRGRGGSVRGWKSITYSTVASEEKTTQPTISGSANFATAWQNAIGCAERAALFSQRFR